MRQCVCGLMPREPQPLLDIEGFRTSRWFNLAPVQEIRSSLRLPEGVPEHLAFLGKADFHESEHTVENRRLCKRLVKTINVEDRGLDLRRREEGGGGDGAEQFGLSK